MRWCASATVPTPCRPATESSRPAPLPQRLPRAARRQSHWLWPSAWSTRERRGRRGRRGRRRRRRETTAEVGTGGVIPLAATIATEEIYQSFWSENTHQAFLHGHSFTANPITCAAALASLDLVETNDILSQVAGLSSVYEARLPRLADHPKVQEVRWLGCIGVVELKPNSGDGGYYDTVGTQLKEEFLKNGVLLRPLGNVVYTLPPYVTPPQELHRVFDLLEQLLD